MGSAVFAGLTSVTLVTDGQTEGQTDRQTDRQTMLLSW